MRTDQLRIMSIKKHAAECIIAFSKQTNKQKKHPCINLSEIHIIKLLVVYESLYLHPSSYN